MRIPVDPNPRTAHRAAGYAVALEQPVQAGAGERRERRLERVEAIVQREQCMPAEGDDQRFLFP